jgi:hypothetical protein
MKKSLIHSIVATDLKENKLMLLSRGYSSLFSEFSKKWFTNEVLHRYPQAKRIEDKSLVGFHYEVGDLIVELK